MNNCLYCNKPVKGNYCNHSCQMKHQSSTRNRKTAERKSGKLTEFKIKCFKCSKEFTVIEREKLFPKKERYFCSRTCANSRSWNDKDKKKKSESNKKAWANLTEEKRNKRNIKISQSLKECYKNKLRTSPLQNMSCLKRREITKKAKLTKENRKDEYLRKRIEYLRSIDYSNKRNYFMLCHFRFNIYKYPEKFDLNLIKKYGWYKAINRGNNPNGVNRDHMYSKSEGFKNKIDPLLISHPANCSLIQHDENLRKRRKCSITIDELKERIKNW